MRLASITLLEGVVTRDTNRSKQKENVIFMHKTATTHKQANIPQRQELASAQCHLISIPTYSATAGSNVTSLKCQTSHLYSIFKGIIASLILNHAISIFN